MKRLTIEEVVEAMGARPLEKPPVTGIARVSTDSRDVRPEDLFFAIPGEQLNGHDFADAALSGGAAFAVVSDPARVPERWRQSGRLITVADTIDALGRLASYHRSQTAASVIGVVGSNGKTTTKELTCSVLRSKKRGRAAAKSFNNHIGVPLTLLSVEPADEFVVVEIGTNHPGEISALAQIARPDVGVVTSIGEEHLEFFGDVSKVADEELSLLPHIRRRGLAVLNIACRDHPQARARQELTVLSFGLEPGCDLWAGDIQLDGGVQRFMVNGRFPYSVPSIGAHNVSNALAAITVGLRFGLKHDEIAAALAIAELPSMRLEIRRFGSVTLINDAYNANPSSMKAALASLEQMPIPGRRVLILGDMRELGEQAGRCHEELGLAAGRSSASVIVAIGAFARTVADGATKSAGASKRTHAFPSIETAIPGIERMIEPGDVVLLKGSRAMRLERLIPAIEKGAAGGADESEPSPDLGKAAHKAQGPRRSRSAAARI